MANAPQRDGTAADMKVICKNRETKNFFAEGWTDRNSLIRLDKFDFTRKSLEWVDDARWLHPGYEKNQN
jgi:hypothetical protein